MIQNVFLQQALYIYIDRFIQKFNIFYASDAVKILQEKSDITKNACTPHKSANFSLTNLFLCATIIIQTNGAVKVSTGIVNPAKHAEIALSL
jgi:hypothetical protein